MTKYVIRPDVAIRLAREDAVIRDEHELLAPTLLRSQVLSRLHEAVARGELDARVARERLATFNRMKIRLLGDAADPPHAATAPARTAVAMATTKR